MAFDFQAIPDVGVPLAGFFPQARQPDPRAAAQAAWLNRGGRPAPVRTAPSLQELNEWTDEDNMIAVMSGADPLGVREAFERYRGQQDEQAFIQGLGDINWRDPGSKSQVGQLLTRFPRGVTQKGLGIMQLLDKLEGAEKDPYRPQVAELGTEYLDVYDQALKAGADKETAMARAASLRQKNSLAEKARVDVRNKFVEAGGDLDKFDELSERYGTDWAGYRDYLNKNKPLAKLEAAERKALTEAFEGYNSTLSAVDESATDEAKIEAFRKVNGRPPQTTKDWQDAYNLVKQEQIAPALGQLSDLVDLYEGKAIPEAITRIVRPAAASPAPMGRSSAPTTSSASKGILPSSVMGYEVRAPFQGEDTYFRANPNVAGMAAEDGKITLNPYSKLSPEELSAVAENEAFRLKMREMNYTPQFSLTPEQQKTLTGSAYEKNPAAAKQTILARILSGDPSVGAITGEQKREAEAFRSRVSGSPAAPAIPAPAGVPDVSVPAMLQYQSPEGPRQVPVASPGTGVAADLKREQPVTFESLARQTAEMAANRSRRAAEEKSLASAGEQKKVDASYEGWERAKADLLQGVSTVPEFLDVDANTPEHHVKFLLKKMGKEWNKPAFTDGHGNTKTWEQVARALAMDPRILRLKDPNAVAPTSPVTTQQQQQLLASLPKVTTREAYDALPSGATYVDSNGRRAMKK